MFVRGRFTCKILCTDTVVWENANAVVPNMIYFFSPGVLKFTGQHGLICEVGIPYSVALFVDELYELLWMLFDTTQLHIWTKRFYVRVESYWRKQWYAFIWSGSRVQRYFVLPCHDKPKRLSGWGWVDWITKYSVTRKAVRSELSLVQANS